MISRRAFTAGLALAACRAPKFVDGRRVITLWFSYGGKNREVLLELVKKFNARPSPYVIEATYQGDYFEALAKLRTAIAANAAPTFSHVVAEVIPYLERAGALQRLDLPTTDLVPQLAQSGSYEGEHPLVAIPFNRSTPIMLMRDGIEPPKTWDELVDTAKRTGGFEVPISWWFWVALVEQAGGSIDDDLGGAAGVRALKFLQDLVHVHHTMRPPPGRDYNAWNATNQDFLAGRAPIIWTSTAFLRYLEENARFPVRAAALPADARRAIPTGGTFFVVLAAAPPEEKEGAYAFLRFMCEADQTIEWATRTGYLPVTHPAIERLRNEGFYARHPNDDVAIVQLDDARPWPWNAELFRVQREVVEPRLEDAVFANRDPEIVMREARGIARRRK